MEKRRRPPRQPGGRERIVVVSIAAILASFACSSIPPPTEPVDEESAALGIALDYPKGALEFGQWFFGTKAFFEGVYFIRVKDEILLRPSGFMRSDWWSGRRAYILNVSPGEYAAIAAIFRIRGSAPDGPETRQFVFFPLEMIEATRTVVSAGQLNFMGHYVIATPSGEGDKAQEHYRAMLNPDDRRRFRIGALYTSSANAIVVERDDGEVATEKFYEAARRDFRDSEWGRLLP